MTETKIRKTYSYGDMPPYEDFEVRFDAETFGTYLISHGTESKRDERARAGNYTKSELWAELQRLMRIGTEESQGWVADVLGTLGFEWI